MTETVVTHGVTAWGRRVRKRTLLALVSGGVLLADQVTKAVVSSAVPQGHRVPILGDFLAVNHLSNTGAALGFQATRPVLVFGLAFASVGLLVLLFWFLPIGRPNRLLATTLAIGGALGNLADRIRTRGVMDLADIAVMTGALWLAWSIWWDERTALSPASESQ